MFEPGSVDLFNPVQKFSYSEVDKRRLKNFRYRYGRKYSNKGFYSLCQTDINKNIITLITDYHLDFDIWWNDSMIEFLYKDQSRYGALSSFFRRSVTNSKKSIWFRPELLNWKEMAGVFIRSGVNWQEVLYYRDYIDWDDRNVLDALVSVSNIKIKDWWPTISKSAKKFILKERIPNMLYRNDSKKTISDWFDKELINYTCALPTLISYKSSYFDIWWDRSKISDKSLKDNMIRLCIHCSQHFDTWFEKDLFDYDKGSIFLLAFCSNKFDKWWDEKKFNYNYPINCWRKPYYRRRNVPYDEHRALDSLREILFNKETQKTDEKPLNTTYYPKLKYCLPALYPDKFDKWYSKIRYRPNRITFSHLNKFCQKHKDVWEFDFLKYELLRGTKYDKG